MDYNESVKTSGKGKNMERVHAVVVTYNRKKLLLECLDAILKQTFPVEKLILIDNNSTDGNCRDPSGKRIYE